MVEKLLSGNKDLKENMHMMLEMTNSALQKIKMEQDPSSRKNQSQLMASLTEQLKEVEKQSNKDYA